MAIFSKPLLVTHTCYEVGHCWTPYCSRAASDIAKKVFVEAIKIYGSLYAISAIFKRRGWKYYVQKVVPETLRSSVFLTINGTFFLAMFCVWRRLLGGVYFWSTSFIPAFVGSVTAILFERKMRRGPLAVYLTNLAVETGYRMLVERKMVTPIAHGEVYIFSVVSAIYLYLFRKQGGLPSSANSLFGFFLGKDEIPKQIETTSTSNEADNKEKPQASLETSSLSSPKSQSSNNNQATGKRIPDDKLNSALSSSSAPSSIPSSLSSSSSKSKHSSSTLLTARLSKFILNVPLLGTSLTQLHQLTIGLSKWMDSLPKHHCCPHNISCFSYITKGGLKMFTLGYSLQALINTLSSLASIVRHPSAFKKCLMSKANLKLAAFLAFYNAIFRAVNCILRWLRNKDSELHGLLAGGLAGLSLRFYKSVTIALYAATKLTEILYFKGIDSCGLPYFPNADVILYSISTAFIFHAAVMEPHTLRPGYWKFLLRVTDQKFAFMNRRLLDVFGANSSKLTPDYWPNYDPRFSKLVPPAS